jgi:PIN domain nuclease of toxin-antitoxin system
MIVLDTHALIWFVSSPGKLSKNALKRINEGIKENEILISSISVWEIFMLVKKERLKLTMHLDTWLEKVENLPFIQFVPVDNRIASQSVNLPEPLHNDPADRIIIATALSLAATLITSDRRILNYSHVSSLW